MNAASRSSLRRVVRCMKDQIRNRDGSPGDAKPYMSFVMDQVRAERGSSGGVLMTPLFFASVRPVGAHQLEGRNPRLTHT
jgi:hypothetical protein